MLSCRRRWDDRLTNMRNAAAQHIPSPAQLDAATGNRDRVVDLLRIVSLVVVIVGHSIMLTVDTSGGRIELGNLLADIPALQASTWLLQILPLFFFAGAAASTLGWSSRAQTPTVGHWLFGRAQRLLRPVVWYLAAVAAVMVILRVMHLAAVADVVARLGVQLLWFLGAYLLILAAVPALQGLRTTRQVLVATAAAWGATALADVVRIGVGVDAVGYLGFVTVWIIPAILGVAYAKDLLSPLLAGIIAVVAVAVDVVLVAAGPYEVSLVTVPGQHISNMSPPSLLLAGHAVALCALAIAGRRALRWIAVRPRIWWWTAMGNRSAMTLYLWHLPVLAAIIAVGSTLGVDRSDPHAVGYLWSVLVQTLLLVGAMIPVTAVIGGLENHPLAWWDDRRSRRAARGRDLVVLVAVLGTAVSVLMVARSGLDGSGWWWLAIAVLGAAIARLMSVDETPRASSDLPIRRRTCDGSGVRRRLPSADGESLSVRHR